MINNKISKRIFVRGKLVTLSPLQIGSGDSDIIDVEILKDFLDKPFIPSTSISGILRHLSMNSSLMKGTNGENEILLKQFWGNHEYLQDKEETISYTSCITIDDLKIEDDYLIALRDNVEIDDESGVAKENAQFNSEILEPGAIFSFQCELELREYHDSEFSEKLLYSLVELLESGEVFLGAKSNNGFGQVKLEGTQICLFDFFKKSDVRSWLKKEFNYTHFTSSTENTFDLVQEMNKKKMKVAVKFAVRSSILIKSYSVDMDIDAAHITSNGRPIIPASSIKGALRHRMNRIAKTINLDIKEDLDNLFGYVDIDNKLAKKGRFRVYENQLENMEPAKQTRIKIDRFTGGTIDGALFNSEPLWNSNIGKQGEIKNRDEETNVIIIIEINKPNEDEGGILLLLLALKDMWSEDLPLGGEKSIGRGRLIGLEMEIRWDDIDLKIIRDNRKLTFVPNDEGAKKLNKKLSQLIANKGGN